MSKYKFLSNDALRSIVIVVLLHTQKDNFLKLASTPRKKSVKI